MQNVSLDKVPGYNLYIGGFISLRRTKALANCRITHILSAIDWSFDNHSQLIKDYKHLHVPVDDVDDENLLEWFSKGNAFIDDGLNHWQEARGANTKDGEDWKDRESGVLVHCAMGKSRSATMILAYLLWDSRRRSLSTPAADPDSETAQIPPQRLSVDAALALLRQGRPIAEPNDGFMDQLHLYYAMGCPDDVINEPRYQRWLYQRSVRTSLSVNQAPEIGTIRFEDEHLQVRQEDLTTRDINNGLAEETDLEIKCRKCRRLLARGNFLVEHQTPEGLAAKHCAHMFLHPLSWMRETLAEGHLDGRLTCPNRKCAANLGKFAWQGMRCSCGGWVTPGFGVLRAKVDATTVVRWLDGAISAEGSGGRGACRLPPGMKRHSGNL